MAALHKHSNGVWYVIYRDDGRQRWKGLGTKVRRDAEKAKRQFEQGIEEGRQETAANVAGQGSVPAPATPAVSDAKVPALDDFLAEWDIYQRGYKADPRYARSDLNTVRRFLARGKIQKLTDITRGKLAEYRTHLVETDCAPATVNSTLSIISGMLRYAVEREYLPTNPARGIKRHRLEVLPPRYLTHEQADCLLDAAWKLGERIWALLAVALHTGLRASELARLKWEDVHLDRGVVTVGKAKSKRFREVPISEELRELLERLPRYCEHVLWTRAKGPWKKSPRSRLIDRAFENAGLGSPSLHLLRHTFASWAVQNGVDVYKVCQWLGHSSITVTERYAHLAQGHDPDIDKVAKRPDLKQAARRPDADEHRTQTGKPRRA